RRPRATNRCSASATSQEWIGLRASTGYPTLSRCCPATHPASITRAGSEPPPPRRVQPARWRIGPRCRCASRAAAVGPAEWARLQHATACSMSGKRLDVAVEQLIAPIERIRGEILILTVRPDVVLVDCNARDNVSRQADRIGDGS